MAGEPAGTVGMLLLAATAVLVVAVEGASLFTVWNLLPLAVAGVVLRTAGVARAAGCDSGGDPPVAFLREATGPADVIVVDHRGNA